MKITKTVKRKEKLQFFLENGTTKTVTITLSKQARTALVGQEFESFENQFLKPKISGVEKESEQKARPDMMEISRTEYNSLMSRLTNFENYMAKSENEERERSRLLDVLNARRSGENSELTKAEKLKRNRFFLMSEQTKLKMLDFEEMPKRERLNFIIAEKKRVQANMDKFGNMTGSVMIPRKGDSEEAQRANNFLFAGGVR